MTKHVVQFLDEDPTTELREFLQSRLVEMNIEDRLKFDRMLDELDTSMDWYYSQNELNRGRVRQTQAELRLRFAHFWAGVEAVERLLSKVSEAAREQRWAAVARERARVIELAPSPPTQLRKRDR